METNFCSCTNVFRNQQSMLALRLGQSEGVQSIDYYKIFLAIFQSQGGDDCQINRLLSNILILINAYPGISSKIDTILNRDLSYSAKALGEWNISKHGLLQLNALLSPGKTGGANEGYDRHAKVNRGAYPAFPASVSVKQHILPTIKIATNVLEHEATSIKAASDVSSYFNEIADHVPVVILALFLNKSVTEIDEKCLPVSITQPNVNNRQVLVTHVFNPDHDNSPRRDDFGTLETALGLGPHTFHMAQYYCFPYEVCEGHPSTTDAKDSSTLIPVLDSHKNVRLVGSPSSKRMSFQSAIELFSFFTGLKPEEYFIGWIEPSATELRIRALQLFTATLRYMAERFHNLATDNDWLDLYWFLRTRLETNISHQGSLFKIYWQGMEPPSSFRMLRCKVWLMLLTVTKIRIGVLDGARRIAGTAYGIMERVPESTGVDQLIAVFFDLNNKTEILQDSLSLERVSKPCNVTMVQTSIEESVGEMFASTELLLCRMYSDIIQSNLTKIKPRTLRDAINTICDTICMGRKEYIPGEFQLRRVSETSDSKRDTTKNDEKKNCEQMIRFCDQLVQLLCRETCPQIRDIVTKAIGEATAAELSLDEGHLEKILIEKIRKDNEILCNPVFLRKTLPETRKDLMGILYFFMHLIGDDNMLSDLQLLVNKRTNAPIYSLIERSMCETDFVIYATEPMNIGDNFMVSFFC